MNAMAPVPHNLDAEQALLGALLLNNDAFYRVPSILKPEHFYEGIHARMFEIIAKLISDGRTVSPVTLKSYFEEKLTEDMTLGSYLASLCTNATTIINVADFARSIYDDAMRRRLIEIATTLDAAARDHDLEVTAKDLVEETEKSLYGLIEANEGGKGVSGFNEAILEALEGAAAAYKRDGALSGVPTGLIDLDRLMGGLQRSDLIILAARPGMGKTSLATNVAYFVASHFVGSEQEDGTIKAERGARVLFYSLEMSSEQLATRILSEQAQIPSSSIRRGAIHEAQFKTLAEVAKRIETIPLWIEDRGGINIAQLATSARRTKRQRGVDMIIVDYIQLLSGTGKRSSENRVQEITEITTKLKALAKELNVPILALSQLSRQVETRDDKRPQLSDLRESGSIEQDADVVLFIYREEYYLAHKEPKEGTEKHIEWQMELEKAHGKADIIIAKQRHGPTGTVPVQFDANLTRFSSLAREDYLPARTA